MNLLYLLTLRSLRARPMRMLLSTFGIVLGVAAILAIGITNRNALQAVDRLFRDTAGKANLVIVSSSSDANGFRQELLPRLRAQPGVSLAAPSLRLPAALLDEATPSGMEMSFMGANIGGLLLYGIDPRLDPQVRSYEISRGRFLSDSADLDEVVLVGSFADQNKLDVGQILQVTAGNQVVKLRIVGLIARRGAGQLNNGSFGILPLEAAQRLFYRQGEIDQVDVVVSAEYASSAGIEQIRQQLAAVLGEEYSVIYPADQGRTVTQMLSNYQIGLNFMSGMALFVGAFLIYNAFSMTVVERTREFGMLRTVGMTRGQITAQVLVEAALLGLVGSGLGLGLGVLMARGLSQMTAMMLGAELGRLSIPQDVAILGAAVGISVAILSATAPALQAGRISPLEALQARGRSKPGWLLRHGWILGLALLAISTLLLVLNPFPYDVQFRLGSMVVFALFVGGALIIPASVGIWEWILRPVLSLLYGRSGRLGSRNLQRSHLRTTLTVAALMVGVSMIVVVWAMTDSFKGDLDEWLQGYLGGDLFVSSSIPMGSEVMKHLESVEGLAAVTPIAYLQIEWSPASGNVEQVTLMAVEPASYTRVTSFQFVQPAPDAQQALQSLANGNHIFIASVMAEKYGLKAGDIVNLRTRIGLRPFTVAAVVVSYYNQGQVFIISWNDLARHFRQSGANAMLLKVESGYTAQQVKETIDSRFSDRDRLVVESNQGMLERISLLMRQAFSMFDVLALIVVLVGYLGITNTLTMNVLERTQEIGMLRGVGMTRGQVITMVMAEAALMGLVGGVLGVVFGATLARLFMLAMTAMSGYRLDFILDAERVAMALFIALVISQVAAFLPALRAARTKILEAIHYE